MNQAERRFFGAHQWATIEAASARIIPSDVDPGALEAGVVRFIDLFLSGIDYVYANPYGSGFLRLEGKDAEMWQERVKALQIVYTDGIRALDAASRALYAEKFVGLSDAQQDEVLVVLSDDPKPVPLTRPVRRRKSVTGEPGFAPVDTRNVPVSEAGLDFFHTLLLHTRMGFYADPVYGGNKDQIGWKVIGFVGPATLADTNLGRYTTADFMLMDAEWPYS
jgi:gluconate 2-dehydrogenase gamma chain